MDDLIKFADFFGVTIDYLVGREEANLPYNEKDDNFIAEFIGYYNGLRQDKKEYFVEMFYYLQKFAELTADGRGMALK
ncbi:hypothetical protein NE664_07135 [Anaerotignum faecicola]|nr:hypothetical protein [Anaerotignum faecicola]